MCNGQCDTCPIAKFCIVKMYNDKAVQLQENALLAVAYSRMCAGLDADD